MSDDTLSPLPDLDKLQEMASRAIAAARAFRALYQTLDAVCREMGASKDLLDELKRSAEEYDGDI